MTTAEASDTVGHMIIDDYLTKKRNLWSPATISSVRAKLNTLIALGGLTKDPHSLYQTLHECGYGLYTIKQYLIIWAKFELEMRASNKTQTFLSTFSYKFKNAYKEKTKMLPTSTLTAAFKEAYKTDKDIYNFLILTAYAGLRKQEALNLKWGQVDPVRSELTVSDSKGGKSRQVPINVSFLSKHNPHSVCSETSGATFSSLLTKFFKTTLPGFTPHDLRAYFITTLANTPGISLREVQLLAGHSSLSTTQKYLRTEFEETKQKLLTKFAMKGTA